MHVVHELLAGFLYGTCGTLPTRLLCRVPQTLGNNFAECSSRRSAHGVSSTGEAAFAECRFSGTRQSFVVCQVVLGKKSVNRTGERDERIGRTGRGTGTLPSALKKALGEVLDVAEC